MFDNYELLRIYYACKADKERREQSEHADMMSGEIERNKQIMNKIAKKLPHMTLD